MRLSTCTVSLWASTGHQQCPSQTAMHLHDTTCRLRRLFGLLSASAFYSIQTLCLLPILCLQPTPRPNSKPRLPHKACPCTTSVGMCTTVGSCIVDDTLVSLDSLLFSHMRFLVRNPRVDWTANVLDSPWGSRKIGPYRRQRLTLSGPPPQRQLGSLLPIIVMPHSPSGGFDYNMQGKGSRPIHLCACSWDPRIFKDPG